MQFNEVYLGDAYELIKQVPDNSVDLVVTDPPYEIVAGGGGGAFGAEKQQYHHEVSFKLNYGITNDILMELDRVMKKTNIYIFCNKNQILQYLDFYKEKNIDLLVWHKTNAIPTVNNKYLSDLEYIVFAREPGTPMFNTYSTSSKLFQTPINKRDKSLYNHPTIKPEFIIKNLIKNSSQMGDYILDPFMGSGTTCAVAKSLARNYMGFEIEEDFYNIAKDRINGITQKDRNMLTQGQTKLF
jgi:DNA modification methylase